MIRIENGEKEKTIMRTRSMVCNSPLGQACEAFLNPSVNMETYFSSEHKQKLIEDSEIVAWDEYREPRVMPGVGVLRYIGITTRQGYEYGVLATEPEEPFLTHENVPIIGTTAWFTSHDGGFNEETVLKLTKDGNYVWILGGEGSYDSGANPEPTSPISLGNSAAAVLNFSRVYPEVLDSEQHRISRRKRMTTGSSRGANIALGITSLADQFDQEVVYADAIAPRYPDRLTLRRTPHLMGQVLVEGAQLGLLPLKLGPRRALHYALSTVDPNVHSLRHQVAIGGAIMNGETGLFADNIPRHQLLDLLLLSRDGSYEHQSWSQKFWAHTEVEPYPMKGIHMDIPLKSIQLGLRDRIKAARECDARGMDMTQENKSYWYQEYAQLRRPLGRRALRTAV